MNLRLRYTSALLFPTLIAAAIMFGLIFLGLTRAMHEEGETSNAHITDALISQSTQHARALATVLADSLINPVYLLDMDGIANNLAAFRHLPGVLDVVAYDSRATVLHDGTRRNARYGLPAEPVDRGLIDADTFAALRRDDEAIRVVVPMLVGRDPVGWIVVALSLAEVRARIAQQARAVEAIHVATLDLVISYAIAATALAALIALLVAFAASRRMSDPIKALSRAAQRVGRGNDEPIPSLTRRDELGQLARSMAEMIGDLRRTTVSKAYVESILASMLDGLLVVDAAGAIVTVNPACCRLLGQSADELADARIATFLPRWPAPGATPPASAEDELRTRGGPVPVLVSCAPLSGASSGGVWVVLIRDVTTLKDAERAMERAKLAAEESNRSKSAFLANVSHELRTPLNAIIGFSDVMRNEMLGQLGHARYREYVRDIHDSGQHLLRIVNDLLDLARIEAGRMTLHDEVFAIKDAVDEALHLVAARAADKRLATAAELSGDLPALRADRRMMLQILLNLLSNAIKFTPEHGCIVVRAGIDSGGGIAISMCDNGIGIAPEGIAKVLAPFGQIDDGLDRRYEGTGLGLPIVKSLAELHGGTFRLESRIGAGTTATVSFPAARAVALAATAA